jgi:hypothetical protein
MYSSVKTTVDISDPLLEAARRAAEREGTTLRALVEAGLRRVLSEAQQPSTFELRDARFEGEGLQPGVASAEWEAIRAAIYEGRGA